MDALTTVMNALPVPLDVLVLLLALLLDLALGEPPNRLHPTVWIGNTVALAERIAPGPQAARAAQLAFGAGMALLIPAAWGAAAWAVSFGLLQLHPLAYVIVVAVLLKTTFSVRMLHRVAAGIGRILTAGEIAEARRQMSALVSRDTSQLTIGQMAAGAIESVAENITDSIVGPLLAFALFGLPGAVAYRAINTLDSMVGYHGRYEYLGKASARLDDLVNVIPARLAAAAAVAVHRRAARHGRRASLAHHVRPPGPHRVAQRRLDHGRHGRRPGRDAGKGRPLPPGRPRAGARGAAHRPRHPRPLRHHRAGRRRRHRHPVAAVGLLAVV